ncbi:hypothetical protein [Clostridium perfringens]|uniref:hypothetical protein n=1 Tax=Clostridium perfringens TaxID=1502 RepID=UPI00233F96FB|nr:hypothetical protein [Clostridium perfringens]MDC4245568.1 hypothetical protein [Clostridium perfringens]
MLKDIIGRENLKKFYMDLSEDNIVKQNTFYRLAQEQSCLNDKKKEIENLYKNDSVDVFIISDDIAIVRHNVTKNNKEEYFTGVLDGNKIIDISTYTFDEALIYTLLKKYQCESGFTFLAKAMNLRIAEN